MKITYRISELVPYINWVYYYFVSSSLFETLADKLGDKFLCLHQS